MAGVAGLPPAPQPAPDIDYLVELGPSFAARTASPQANDTCYATLRYDFKPASADAEQPGVLVIGNSNNRVSLYLANSATGDWDVVLSGKYEGSGRDALDCVAVFDGEGFRLEGLVGHMNTKHARDAAPYRPEDQEHSPVGTSSPPGGAAQPASLRHLHQQHSPQQTPEDGAAASRPGAVAGQRPTVQAGPAPTGMRQLTPPQQRSKPAKGGPPSGGGAGKPPRPPPGAAGSGAAGGGPAGQGKKRKGQAAAAGQPAAPPSNPTGTPTASRKTSRLATATGPVAAGAAAAAAVPPPPSHAQHHAVPAPVSGGGNKQAAPAEPEIPEDVDPDLEDAFDAAFDEMDDGGDQPDAAVPAPASQEPQHASQQQQQPAASPLGHAATPGEMDPFGGTQPVAASPPRARLVVDTADDDEYGDEDYGGGMDEEAGLDGIEYF